MTTPNSAPATLAAYLTAHAKAHALATLLRRLAAIAWVHREARQRSCASRRPMS